MRERPVPATRLSPQQTFSERSSRRGRRGVCVEREQYTDQGQDHYEERYRERCCGQLSKRIEKLGMKVVATAQPI